MSAHFHDTTACWKIIALSAMRHVKGCWGWTERQVTHTSHCVVSFHGQRKPSLWCGKNAKVRKTFLFFSFQKKCRIVFFVWNHSYNFLCSNWNAQGGGSLTNKIKPLYFNRFFGHNGSCDGKLFTLASKQHFVFAISSQPPTAWTFFMQAQGLKRLF